MDTQHTTGGKTRVVVVSGGREFSNEPALEAYLHLYAPTLVVHGGASGADALADVWAHRRAVPCLRVPADWMRHGKSAGPRRNRAMLQIAKAIAESTGATLKVICFPGGRGTHNCWLTASELGLSPIHASCATKEGED